MSKVDNLMIGSVGISNGPGQAPTVILFPNGTVSAVNFSANINSNVSFNAPNANCIFESIELVTTDPAFDQTKDRLLVSFNDGAGASGFQFALASDATLIMEQTGVGSTYTLTRAGQLTLNSPGAGVQINAPNGNPVKLTTAGLEVNAPNNVPQYTFYCPDTFGAIGMYNISNGSYEWRIQQNGNTQITDSVTINGSLTVNGTFTSQITPYVVNSQANPANIFTGPSGDSVVIVNIVGGSATQFNAVLLPVDAPNGTTVSVVLANPGSGFPIVRTTSPSAFQFRGQGQQLAQVNLMNIRGGSSTQNYVCNFTFVNYGSGAGDDWLVTIS